MKFTLPDEIQRSVKRLREERDQFARLMAEADPYRKLREAADQEASWAKQLQLSQAAPFDTSRFSFMSSLGSTLHRDTLTLTRQIEGALSERRIDLSVFQALHRPAFGAALTSILHHQKELSELSKGLKRQYDDLVAPARQIQWSLAALEAAARVSVAPATHWSNALSVIASFERFATQQTKKLDGDPRVVAARRARITELAGTLLVSTVGASQAAGGEPSSDAPTITTVTPRIFGPLNSHLGYVYRSTVEVDVDLAMAGALPTRICHLGGAIVAKAVRINDVLRFSGGDDVFRPTNRSLWAAAVIPAVVTDSENGFAEVVDALFFLLYEGSGAASSRLASLLGDDDLRPLWQLKQLRLYYRHDTEHGDKRGVEKKRQKIAAAFGAIGGGRLPGRPAEWTAAQAELYRQLLAMLTKAEEAVRKQGPAV